MQKRNRGAELWRRRKEGFIPLPGKRGTQQVSTSRTVTPPLMNSENHSVMYNSANLWGIFCQASLSMGFSRQEYWNGLSFPSAGCLLDPGIKPRAPAFQADSLPSEPQEKPPR